MKSSVPHTIVLGLTDTQIDLSEPLDLTDRLQLVRIAGTGSLSVVYRCSFARSMDVAVKAIILPPGFDSTKQREEFTRKMECGLRTWKTLNHPNIVPLLGTAYGHAFGSDYPCTVSMWMKNGTLFDYVKQPETKPSLRVRIQLVKGSATGLEYLHSLGILHGNLHPANILIDDGHNPRLTDFAFRPGPDQLSPGPVLWTAPELLYPELYPNLGSPATLQGDIYSLGSIILFILSGQYPWQDRGEAENKLKQFQNPPRPAWPVDMPDGVWDFVERCWSPQDPGNRPSVQEVLSFSEEKLEQLYRPKDADVDKARVGSRLSSEVMLEDCVLSDDTILRGRKRM